MMGRDVEYNRMYRQERTNSPNPRGLRQSLETPRVRQAVTTHNDYCQHISLVNGHLRMCEEPTQGHTYCPACSMHLITLTDRALPTQDSIRAAKGHPWAEESFDFATRKKRRRQAA